MHALSALFISAKEIEEYLRTLTNASAVATELVYFPVSKLLPSYCISLTIKGIRKAKPVTLDFRLPITIHLLISCVQTPYRPNADGCVLSGVFWAA